MTSLAPRGPRDALSLHHETVREQLPNGLTLLVRRDRSAPVVAIVTHVKAGYFDETDDIVGIAHVLEHMFFKGTATRGVGQIARETKTNGGYLNAHTIYDHTSYYTVLPSAALLQGLDIQFDAYANSVIDAGELARELEVIIQEAKRKRDSPHAVAIESLYALLHDQHRIRRWRIGDEDPLRALTRDQLMSFYRYWYRPSNTVLSIVGDVDPDQVRREVMARHGTLDAGEPERARGPMETSAPGFRFREWTGDIAQQQLAFGWRAPGIMHPDSAALDLAAIALGTGRASRLYRAVRERQLASSVSAWNYTTDNIGVFVTGAESPSAHAPEAAVQLWREVQAARTVGFRTSEVVRAQRIIEARWLRRLESMDGQASYLASWEAEGGLDLATTYYERLMALTADALQDAVKRHLDPSQVSMRTRCGKCCATWRAPEAACCHLQLCRHHRRHRPLARRFCDSIRSLSDSVMACMSSARCTAYRCSSCRGRAHRSLRSVSTSAAAAASNQPAAKDSRDCPRSRCSRARPHALVRALRKRPKSWVRASA